MTDEKKYRMSIPKLLKIVKRIYELMDDQAKDSKGLILIHPKFVQEVEPGYVTLPYVFKRELFEEVFVKELKLEECIHAQETLGSGASQETRS